MKEKAMAVCEGCETICAAWVTPDGDVVPVSPANTCTCGDAAFRALDAETVF